MTGRQELRSAGRRYGKTRREFVSMSACAAAFAACAGPDAASDNPKAVVFNISKLAVHDGPGMRTVAFLKGCPLRCVWCHSPESWNYRVEKYPNGETVGREWTVDALLAEVMKDKDFYDVTGGGVTLSGGEPLAHPDFCAAFFRRAKAAGLHTAVETSGFAPASTIDALIPFVDVWLYDIKLMDSAACEKYTSRPLAPVLANLRLVNAACVSSRRGEIVLRCPMIPGINDGPEELRRRGGLADGLAAVSRVEVIPYVPYGIEKAKRLGLSVYEAPMPPAEYGPGKVMELSRLTRKHVRLG